MHAPSASPSPGSDPTSTARARREWRRCELCARIYTVHTLSVSLCSIAGAATGIAGIGFGHGPCYAYAVATKLALLVHVHYNW